MAFDQWPTNKWPMSVSHNVYDYNKALFKILDESARDYPDNVFTIFNGATKTFSQVKDTADRIANFLVSKGIKKGDRVAIFLPNIPPLPGNFFRYPKSRGRLRDLQPFIHFNRIKLSPERFRRKNRLLHGS